MLALIQTHLSAWITALLVAVPLGSHATFIELLCGCLASNAGWTTWALGAIERGCHWSTYFKLIERDGLVPLHLARAMLGIVERVLGPGTLNFVVDDTLVPRHSTKAPGSAVRFDHAHKNNRPTYLLSQCWVTLGVYIGKGRVLPVLSRLVPTTGNRNKISLALALVKVVAKTAQYPVRLLCDSWFMRRRLIQPLLKRGIHVLGQARRDTALFLMPALKPQGPGRPRKYGERLYKENLPSVEYVLPLYGKEKQRVRLYCAVSLARFLKGTPVHAVWCEFFNEKTGVWSKARLLLATEPELSAENIVLTYARRWSIEPLFHNLKRWFGVSNLWHQRRKVLERMMQLRCLAWSLLQLLQHVAGQALPVAQFAPWRTRGPVTTGLMAQWVRLTFTGLHFRSGYDRKSRKFTMPMGSFRPPAPTG